MDRGLKRKVEMVRRMVFFGLAVLLISGVATAEQAGMEKYIELLRHDLRAAKVAVVTEFLPLSDAQAAEFWPIYREYELEIAKLTDEWLELLRDYEDHHGEMTDSKAKEMLIDLQVASEVPLIE